MTTRPTIAAVLSLVAILLMPSGTCRAQAESTEIEIDDKVLPNGNYQWTVINRADKVITEVIIPHYHGDLFITPREWSQQCTYLVNVGVPDKPGTCRAFVESERDGIRRGGRTTFELRIARSGAREGRGDITLRFADGSETTVSNIIVPTTPHYSEHFLGPIALGVLLLAAIGYEMRRRRRVRAQPPSSEPPANES